MTLGVKTNALQEGDGDQQAAENKGPHAATPPWELPDLRVGGWGAARGGLGGSPAAARLGAGWAFPSLPFPRNHGHGHDLICKGGEAGTEAAAAACHISNKEHTTKGLRTQGFVRIQRWERFI